MPKIAGIDFDQRGEGYPTVICLHGIGGDSDSFLPQLDFFSKNLRIISWNMPGYKNSDYIENLTFEKLSYCLFNFIKSLKIKKCHLIGQSIGGMIAQDFACRFPELIEGLVLLATTSAFGGKNDDFKKEFIKSRLQPLDEGINMDFLAKITIPKIVGKKIEKKNLDIAINSMAKIPEKTYREILKCLVTFDRYFEIEKLAIPCCLLSGKIDNNAPARTMQKMSLKIQNSQFHIFEKVGHLINLEIPEVSNTIISKFLNSLKVKL